MTIEERVALALRRSSRAVAHLERLMHENSASDVSLAAIGVAEIKGIQSALLESDEPPVNAARARGLNIVRDWQREQSFIEDLERRNQPSLPEVLHAAGSNPWPVD